MTTRTFFAATVIGVLTTALSSAVLAAPGAARAAAAPAAAPAPAGGAAALERFEGTWTGTGTFVNSAYSKAGTAIAKTTCAWSADRQFMICQQSVVVDGKAPAGDVAIYTYDPAAAKYHFYNVGTAGANGTQIAVDGDTVTYSDTFEDGGKKVSTRTLNVWDGTRHYRWRVEYSLDGGTTWVLMASGDSNRTP